MLGSLVFASLFPSGIHGTIHIDIAKKGPAVSKGLYGVFLEEINNSGEGGLYAELIQNRGFEDANTPPACALVGDKLYAPKNPSFWEGHSKDFNMEWPYANLGPTPFWSFKNLKSTVTDANPLSEASRHSVRIEAQSGGVIRNEGFWGIGLKSGETYEASAFVRSSSFKGTLKCKLVGPNGELLGASTLNGTLKPGHWVQLKTKLKATGTSSRAKFEIETSGNGEFQLDFVSLMPTKTWRNLPLRTDLAQMIADLKPGFIRWPGGCVTEGITIETRPRWKQTIGPLHERVPTFIPWGYWVSNGYGYHEWLLHCEALKAEPLYVFNAGISCAFRSGTFLGDAELTAEIQDILDAIEYATGPVTSKYGALRAKAGHPKPFAMNMIEIGNEDQGPKYGERFKRIAAAVKAKYPKIKTILSSWIAGIDHAAINAAGPQMDIVDEHAYIPAHWGVQNFDSFGKYSRKVPWELYIGEFATNSGVGRGNMNATLGDCAYMMSIEKNSDLVKMGSYAPLLENTNRRQWEVNLIHFDSARAYGRASYYACKLFAENVPTYNVSTKVDMIETEVPGISGPIGIGTYLTHSEFKDLKVNGQPIASPWKARNGIWSQVDGAYVQKSLDFDQWGFFEQEFRDGTVELKARKISGEEGFVVSVGNAEGRRVQFNIGGWGNRQHGLEAQGVIRRINGSVETGRWYDVKVITSGRRVQCFLDGKQLFDETLPRVDTLLSIAGYDKATGEIIVKVLNAANSPRTISLEVANAKLTGTGTWTTLGSPDVNAENDYSAPKRIYPSTRALGKEFKTDAVTLPANSINIFRLKTGSQ